VFGALLQISTGFASWQRYCTASSSGRQPNFSALNRGRHLCLTGRPSGWALAHILVILSFQQTPTVICFFAICGEQHSVFLIVLKLVATTLHCTGGLIELLTCMAAILLLSLSSYSVRSFSSFQRLLLLFQYALRHPFW